MHKQSQKKISEENKEDIPEEITCPNCKKVVINFSPFKEILDKYKKIKNIVNYAN